MLDPATRVRRQHHEVGLERQRLGNDTAELIHGFLDNALHVDPRPFELSRMSLEVVQDLRLGPSQVILYELTDPAARTRMRGYRVVQQELGSMCTRQSGCLLRCCSRRWRKIRWTEDLPHFHRYFYFLKLVTVLPDPITDVGLRWHERCVDGLSRRNAIVCGECS